MPVAATDTPKTAITTLFQLCELLKMPFRPENATQAFQCLIDRVCYGLYLVFVYNNPSLETSRDIAVHKLHLQQLLQHLKEHGLDINVPKCQFGRSNIDFWVIVSPSMAPCPFLTKSKPSYPSSLITLNELN